VPLENQHHHISPANSLRQEKRCRTVAFTAHIGKCKGMHLSGLITPAHCAPIRFSLRYPVDDIIGEIELIGDPELEVDNATLTVQRFL